MYINAKSIGNTLHAAMIDFCPNCGVKVNFLAIQGVAIRDASVERYIAGTMKCSNPDCFALIYVVADRTNNKIVDTYPKRRIPFVTKNIPQPVLEALKEAITCHANNCYMASAIMVRKTLEEICYDRNATGANLNRRIESLKTIVTLPPVLLAGIHELRLIGNDAAHVDLETFPEIGPEELELAIDFTKELLKGIYQYDDLLGRFAALKNKAPNTPIQEAITELRRSPHGQ